MSYEGHVQYICKNGHRFDTPESYGQTSARCDLCNAEPAWGNQVDDTNCEADGIIIDFSSLVIENKQTETCNLGHEHVIKHTRYRPPTKEEARALRRYWSGVEYHKLNEGPRAARRGT